MATLSSVSLHQGQPESRTPVCLVPSDTSTGKGPGQAGGREATKLQPLAQSRLGVQALSGD